MASPAPSPTNNERHLIISDGTPKALVELAGNPLAITRCTFGHSEAQPAITIWYMPLGCVALDQGPIAHTPLLEGRLQDHRVQALCIYHTDEKDPHQQSDRVVPPCDPATAASVPRHLLSGAHLLVDLTFGIGSGFPERPWSACGPHWSDDCRSGPPALELGYTLDDLRTFAASDLGRLVFYGYSGLLESPRP